MNLFDLENLNGNNLNEKSEQEKSEKTDEILTVSKYLDLVNINLKKQKARIIGEVFGIQEYVGRSYLYYSIKDKTDQSTIKCFMWKKDYTLSAIKLEEGLEIILTAYPAVYKPNGGLSLQVSYIELVGEGALKIAYEKLKVQLEKEGIFDQSKKREIPEFPKRIGVITSKSGAVINDFLTNIPKFGFEIIFVDSKVEGESATKDLLTALRILYKENIDCLVLIRGGGSLESFQAFNNENIVRAVSKFNVPVITGIGHDKDIPLVSLVSDKNVSTPTAVANLLGHGFVKAKGQVSLYEQKILNNFENFLKDKLYFVEEAVRIMESHFQNIFHKFDNLKNSISNSFKTIFDDLIRKKDNLVILRDRIYTNFNIVYLNQKDSIENFSKNLVAFDPEKRLRQGYSIIRIQGKVLKSKTMVKKGDDLEVQVSDGFIVSKVIN